jgi:LPXTG-motif cell wall-anchored protein
VTVARAIVLFAVALALALVLTPGAAAQLPPVVGGEPPAEGPAPEPAPPPACDPDLQDCGEPCSPDVDDSCVPECDGAECVGTGPGVVAPPGEGGGRSPDVDDEGPAGGGGGFTRDVSAQGGPVVAGVTRELPATGGEALVLALAGLALLAGGLSLRLRLA